MHRKEGTEAVKEENKILEKLSKIETDVALLRQYSKAFEIKVNTDIAELKQNMCDIKKTLSQYPVLQSEVEDIKKKINGNGKKGLSDEVNDLKVKMSNMITTIGIILTIGGSFISYCFYKMF